MKSKITIAILLLLMVSCAQIAELTSLLNCEFRLSSATNIKMAGIDVQNIKSYTDLKLSDGAKLISAVASGTLPLILTLNVEAKNPNAQKAALNKLDWILLIDNIEMTKGTTESRIEIPPNGTGIFPIQATTDLAKVLTGQSAKSIVNFGLNLAGIGSRPTRITLKAKPTIMVGSSPIVYPGYINIKSEYGSK
jgi:hypothetical protein